MLRTKWRRSPRNKVTKDPICAIRRLPGWLLIGLVLTGCFQAPLKRSDRTASVPAIPLVGSEIAVGDGADLVTWVTPEQEISLSYESERRSEPELVVFFARRAGSQDWHEVALWTPGQLLPSWRPQEQGRWELVAAEYDAGAMRRKPGQGMAQVAVAFDWDAPHVRIDEILPSAVLRGGEVIPIRYTLFEEFPVSGQGSNTGLQLELSQGAQENWRKIADLPAHGQFDWTVPNRPLAGALLRIVAVDSAGNRGFSEIPGSLTVQGVAPRVTLPGEYTTRAIPQELPYRVELPGRARVDRVELWVTDDGGYRWRLAGYDHDREPPFQVELEQGSYGVWVVVLDEFGNRSPYPEPGDPPRSMLSVDWTAPVVEWGNVEVQPLAIEDGERRIEVLGEYAIRDIALDDSSLSIEYRPRGEPWRPLPGRHYRQGQYRFRALEEGPEPLEVRMRGQDQSGNPFSETHQIYPSDFLHPPELVFEEAPTGWQRGNDTLRIRYRTTWRYAIENGVSLEYTYDGETWRLLAEDLPASGVVPWSLPLRSQESVRLRLTVRGRDNRVLTRLADEPFAIDAQRPEAHLVSPHVGHGELIPIFFEARDGGGSGLERIQLLAQRVGTDDWMHAGEAEPGQKLLQFKPAIPGEYRLWLVPVDAAGNTGLGPRQVQVDDLFAFTVETGPPGIRMKSFQEGGVFAGGSRHLVFLEWSSGRTAGGIVDVQYSADNGGTWNTIQRMSLSQDRVLWVLPDEDIAECRVRAVAVEVTGRRTVDQSYVPFAIDASAPRVKIQSVEPTILGDVAIDFETEDIGDAGVRQVWVYYTLNEGSLWKAWPEPFPAVGRLTLQLPQDAYGFLLCAEDQVGNMSAEPVSGTVPWARLRLGSRAGVEFSLLNPSGGVLAGGTRHYVFWRLEPADVQFSERPVSLEYRIADEPEWRLVRSGLPLAGKVPWYVPEQEDEMVQLRLIAHDLHGTRYEASSREPIRIDSTVPTVVYKGPTSSNTRPTTVEYSLLKGDALTRVQLWIRELSTPDWTQVAEAGSGEPLEAEIPDGMYRVALVAVDGAGNRGPIPTEADDGTGDLIVDTVTPLLEVDVPGQRERVFHEGQWLVLRPRMTDRHTSSFPISFRASVDGGESYQELKRYHPNAEEFSWRLPDRPGTVLMEVTAEDLAGNRAREIIPIQVLPTPPLVTLLTEPKNAILPAGEELRLEWESQGVDPAYTGVVLEYTLGDGTWQRLAADLPADGHYVWSLPQADSSRCQLRFTLTRPDGLTGITESGVFTISSTTPEVKVEGVTPRRN